VSSPDRIGSFAEFWPFYLGEHRQPGTRALHLIGTSIAFLLIVLALVRGNGWFVLGALLVGYAFAWVGHFAIEHNRPATFKYPLWSFAADWKMWSMALTGRLGAELRRAHVVRT
jgi:hypothetical protein